MKRILVLFILIFPVYSVCAHEVLHQITKENVYVITIAYSDGSPFSYENYQIFSPESSIPFQTGNCDANGRILFLPDKNGTWKIRAFTEDGHGVTAQIEVKLDQTFTKEESFHPALKMVSGVLGIIIVFILLYLFSKRSKK